jgi:hypothetical protein
MQISQISDPQDCALAVGAGAALGALNGIAHGPAGVAVGSLAGGIAGYASAGACHSAATPSYGNDGVDVDARAHRKHHGGIESNNAPTQAQRQ